MKIGAVHGQNVVTAQSIRVLSTADGTARYVSFPRVPEKMEIGEVLKANLTTVI